MSPLSANGAFAKHGDVFYKVDIPKIDVVNPVGSGDSTVAGIASGLYHHESDADLLKKANVLGMLNAQEAQTGHVNMGHYDCLVSTINRKRGIKWVLTEQNATIWNVLVQRRCHFSFGLRPTWSFETLDGQIPRPRTNSSTNGRIESPCSR